MALMPAHGRRNHIHDHFAVEPLDPFGDLLSYENLLAPPHAPFHNEAMPLPSPHVEWKETPEAYMFRTDLPGFRKEEVQVKVEDGKFLKISGEKKAERGERHENWQWAERSKGKFMSAFTLPENCRADRLNASMANGVLTVTVPKREHSKHSHHVQVIDIN